MLLVTLKASFIASYPSGLKVLYNSAPGHDHSDTSSDQLNLSRKLSAKFFVVQTSSLLVAIWITN